jgi:hypothetical protein
VREAKARRRFRDQRNLVSGVRAQAVIDRGRSKNTAPCRDGARQEHHQRH